MKLNRELTSRRSILAKGFLFAVILVLASGVNLSEGAMALRGASLLLVVWSSARLYYFMFYVIEKYVDSRYRFAGVISFLQYLARNAGDRDDTPHQPD